MRQAAAGSVRPPGRQGAPSASSAVSQRLTLGVRTLRAHRGHPRRRLPTCAVIPGLQDVEMGARVSRAFRNFNLENRTEREISKMKPSTAPKHPSTRGLLQKQLSRECGSSLPPRPPVTLRSSPRGVGWQRLGSRRSGQRTLPPGVCAGCTPRLAFSRSCPDDCFFFKNCLTCLRVSRKDYGLFSLFFFRASRNQRRSF